MIEVHPRGLKNLEQICEVLYSLHPTVLNYMVDELIDDNEILLGEYDLKKYEYRESLAKINENYTKEDIKKIEVEDEDEDVIAFKEKVNIMHADGEYPKNEFIFKRLLRFLQLDTYEYIPIKFYVDVEDPILRKKIKKLIYYLEGTSAPEQIYLHKREVDCSAYFAEGYGLTMNEDQKKKEDELWKDRDPEKLRKLLVKEKLFYH